MAGLGPYIFVTGAPASGKTSLAVKLADRLGAPLLEKDFLKESTWEEMTARGILPTAIDRRSSDLLSGAMCAVMFRILTRFPPHLPVVLESDFTILDIPRALVQSERRIVEIHCRCDREVRMKRFTQRMKSERHPVHADDEDTLQLLLDLPDSHYQPIGVGSLIELDTTGAPDIKALVKQIAAP